MPENIASDERVPPDFPVEVTVDESYELDPKENSTRTQKVKDSYGIDFEVGELDVIDDVSVTVQENDILLATGASGAGKTTFCEAVADELDAVTFESVDVPRGVPVVDLFPDSFETDETQQYMGMFGLGDAHLNLRTYEELSQGQKYRAKLAYTAARFDVIFADEFCATLDRETARTISYSVRRQLAKGRISNTFIFATTHRDIIDDLRPDVLLDFDTNEVKKKSTESERETPMYRSRSRINSNSPRRPKKTGRISLGGII